MRGSGFCTIPHRTPRSGARRRSVPGRYLDRTGGRTYRTLSGTLSRTLDRPISGNLPSLSGDILPSNGTGAHARTEESSLPRGHVFGERDGFAVDPGCQYLGVAQLGGASFDRVTVQDDEIGRATDSQRLSISIGGGACPSSTALTDLCNTVKT